MMSIYLSQDRIWTAFHFQYNDYALKHFYPNKVLENGNVNISGAYIDLHGEADTGATSTSKVSCQSVVI